MFQGDARGVDGVTMRDEIGCGRRANAAGATRDENRGHRAHIIAPRAQSHRDRCGHPGSSHLVDPENGDDANTCRASAGIGGVLPALVMQWDHRPRVEQSAGVDGLLGVHRVAQWAAHQEPHSTEMDQRSADISRSATCRMPSKRTVSPEIQCAVGLPAPGERKSTTLPTIGRPGGPCRAGVAVISIAGRPGPIAWSSARAEPNGVIAQSFALESW